VFIIIIKKEQGSRLPITNEQATDRQAANKRQRTWKRRSNMP
jgi:hypothetical protein